MKLVIQVSNNVKLLIMDRLKLPFMWSVYLNENKVSKIYNDIRDGGWVNRVHDI
jgi:hypothetical protein